MYVREKLKPWRARSKLHQSWKGQTLKKLLAELADVCTPEEARRRIELPRSARAEMMRPKHEPSGTEPRRD
jgi:hypothetical protein